MSTWSLSLGDLVLVPRPRVLQPTGMGPRVEACTVTSAVDPSVPAQGFRLDITVDRGARIAHRDDAGLRYARSLLDQLLAHPVGGHVLGVHVEDHPDIPVRAFMLDVSRDRVPTRETLDELVDVLALVRFNQLQLYIEHTFAHEGHEAVWADASPVTADDLTWLDGRCRAAGIELGSTGTASATSSAGSGTRPTPTGRRRPTAPSSCPGSGSRRACWLPPRTTPTSPSGWCASSWRACAAGG